MELTHHYARVNGVRLHWVEAGSGPPVILLHGFPETHRSWDLQLPFLVARGYRVIAPDLRGYGESARPAGGYDLDTLVADVVALCRHVSNGRVRLVGHDWGGAITWLVASRHPDLLERVVVIDCAHPILMERALRSNPRQLAKSWYMFFFQLPLVPELWLSSRGAKNLAGMFRGTPGAERAPREVVNASRAAVGRISSLGPPLAYYRSALRGAARALWRGERHELPRIDVPVTLLWGEHDACFVLELAEAHRRLAPELSLHILRGAGHFAHQEVPEQVDALLAEALGDPAPGVAARSRG
ncbi:MAG: alpha/beta hydrolase [Polyangiaceae bacterium]|nr:alpha/beta hydrolase [Polyangiaceae bacterium]MCL4751888.1 alpha/beta hydrolase [Myxococcales bacterium]